MTDYLLILSVGPVQSMIAAARRSRDYGVALLYSLNWQKQQPYH